VEIKKKITQRNRLNEWGTEGQKGSKCRVRYRKEGTLYTKNRNRKSRTGKGTLAIITFRSRVLLLPLKPSNEAPRNKYRDRSTTGGKGRGK